MPEYAVGPGRPRSHGAVVDAYTATRALEVACPACGVQPDEFCRHETSQPRKMPCPVRIRDAARSQEQKGSHE